MNDLKQKPPLWHKFQALLTQKSSSISKNKFIIKGDLSGIQSFIFNIPSKGASKYLKGRSAYLQLLPEVIALYIHDRIIMEIGSSTAFADALIYLGGGNFMLAYDTEKDLTPTVAKLHKEVEEILLKYHHSTLYLALAGTKVGDNYQTELNKTLMLQKKSKYIHQEDVFKDFVPKEQRDIGNKKPSEFLESFKDLTEKFIKAKFFSFENSSMNTEKLNYESVFAAFGRKVNFEKGDKIYNSTAPSENDRFYVNRIDISSFDHLVGYATGAQKLAILKMDADNLGALFQGKSPEETKNISKSLSYFFEGYLSNLIDQYVSVEAKELREEDGQQIVRNYPKGARLVYTVYSGGDDCFLIGPWDVMVELAGKIQEEFMEYIKPLQNDLTISASLTIIDDGFPVIQGAALAEEYLLEVKHHGKNGINVFGEVFNWEEWKYIRRIKELLIDVIENSPTKAKSVIRKVASTAEPFRKINEGSQKYQTLKMESVFKLMYYVRELKSDRDELSTIYKEIILNRFLSPTMFKKSSNLSLKEVQNVNAQIIPAACRLTELIARNK